MFIARIAAGQMRIDRLTLAVLHAVNLVLGFVANSGVVKNIGALNSGIKWARYGLTENKRSFTAPLE